MKQYIIPEQLNELSDKAKENMRKWLISKEYIESDNEAELHHGFWTIGQMIEFLDQNVPKNKDEFNTWMDLVFYYTTNDDGIHKRFEGELCDALWEAIKEILK